MIADAEARCRTTDALDRAIVGGCELKHMGGATKSPEDGKKQPFEVVGGLAIPRNEQQ